jgi:hypothetical protein
VFRAKLILTPAVLTFVGKAPKAHTNSSARRKAAGQSCPAAFQVLDQKVSLSAPCMTRGGMLPRLLIIPV